jgi:hypothetical protein
VGLINQAPTIVTQSQGKGGEEGGLKTSQKKLDKHFLIVYINQHNLINQSDLKMLTTG